MRLNGVESATGQQHPHGYRGGKRIASRCAPPTQRHSPDARFAHRKRRPGIGDDESAGERNLESPRPSPVRSPRRSGAWFSPRAQQGLPTRSAASRIGCIREIMACAKSTIARARNDRDPQSGIAFKVIENPVELEAGGRNSDC